MMIQKKTKNDVTNSRTQNDVSIKIPILMNKSSQNKMQFYNVPHKYISLIDGIKLLFSHRTNMEPKQSNIKTK